MDLECGWETSLRKRAKGKDQRFSDKTPCWSSSLQNQSQWQSEISILFSFPLCFKYMKAGSQQVISVCVCVGRASEQRHCSWISCVSVCTACSTFSLSVPETRRHGRCCIFLRGLLTAERSCKFIQSSVKVVSSSAGADTVWLIGPGDGELSAISDRTCNMQPGFFIQLVVKSSAFPT